MNIQIVKVLVRTHDRQLILRERHVNLWSRKILSFCPQAFWRPAKCIIVRISEGGPGSKRRRKTFRVHMHVTYSRDTSITTSTKDQLYSLSLSSEFVSSWKYYFSSRSSLLFKYVPFSHQSLGSWDLFLRMIVAVLWNKGIKEGRSAEPERTWPSQVWSCLLHTKLLTPSVQSATVVLQALRPKNCAYSLWIG